MTQRDLDLKSQARHLLIEIRTLIEETRRQTAVAVNIGSFPLLSASAGASTVVLSVERAVYGEQIVVMLSRQLSRSATARCCASARASRFRARKRQVDGMVLRTSLITQLHCRVDGGPYH